MTKQTILRRSLIAVLGTAFFAATAPGMAFDFGNMMNPSKWMGGGRDRSYGYEGGPWGDPGLGYGAPGYGGYGGPGYGGYGGYGGPGYGGPGYGGYGGPGYGAPGGFGGPGSGYGSDYPGAYGTPLERGATPAAPAGPGLPVYGGGRSSQTSSESTELER